MGLQIRLPCRIPSLRINEQRNRYTAFDMKDTGMLTRHVDGAFALHTQKRRVCACQGGRLMPVAAI